MAGRATHEPRGGGHDHSDHDHDHADHDHERHGHKHGRGHSHAHGHGLVHESIKRSREGLRAVGLALVVLGVAAVLQLITVDSWKTVRAG